MEEKLKLKKLLVLYINSRLHKAQAKSLDSIVKAEKGRMFSFEK